MQTRRRRSRGAAGLALALTLLCAAWVEADSYRCGRKLIRTGDSIGEVLRVCGEPLSKDRGEAELRLDGVSKRVSVQRLHYRQGRRSLPHVVLIHKGRVVAIEIGSR
jgi:hypothetical protein